MKIAIGFTLALALALFSVPASAGDTFHAFSSMPSLEQASFTPLSDAELASIEGGRDVEICVVCVNRTRIRQTNVTIASRGSANIGTYQTNVAAVRQEIN